MVHSHLGGGWTFLWCTPSSQPKAGVNMPLSPAQLSILKNEFTVNPRGYPYEPWWSQTPWDGGLPQFINAVRDGTNPPTNPTAAGGNADGHIKLNQKIVDTGAVRAAVTFEGYDGLVTAEKSWFNWLTINGIITVNPHLLQKLAGIGAEGPTGAIWAAADRVAMNTALELLMRRFGSRSEELFGLGVAVSVNDVSNCRSAA